MTGPAGMDLTVVGKDRKGVVAAFTGAVFRRGGNVESVNQSVVSGLFGMHLEATFTALSDRLGLEKELRGLGKEFGMEVGVHYRKDGAPNMVVMVTRERHCLATILDAAKKGQLRAKVAAVIGSEPGLGRLAKRYGVPFHSVEESDRAKMEKRVLSLLQRYDADIIALARYMRILGPNLVWRYPNRIVNIHPSLLPAFPGALPYQQAYERGARIIGCTAHFVTTELDEGPIIWQEAFNVSDGETLETIKTRGQELEAKALLKALRLLAEGRLEVRWGRTHILPKSHR